MEIPGKHRELPREIRLEVAWIAGIPLEI